jgi:predicted ATPase
VDGSQSVVISGGPGAGKTTLLLELERRGFRCAPEVARQIIQEQVQRGGSALPWADRTAYIELMLQGSMESFDVQAPASAPMFAERGIPDALGYARLIAQWDMRAIELACRRYRSAMVVFLAPPRREILGTDSERTQDFGEAERTYVGLAEVYAECGYRTVE